MPAAKNISDYLDGLTPAARKQLDAIRKAIKKAVPDAKPCFSYNIPGFSVDGRPVIWYAAWKKHASMYPIGEDIRKKFAKELKGYAFSKGTIRFPYSDPPSAALVGKLAKARAAEMRAQRGPKKQADGRLGRLRKICLALPDTTEKEAWGVPTFRVKDKLFAMYADPDNHHDSGRPAVWVNSLPENQSVMIAMDPDRFYKPAYVGASGWIGIWLDRNVSWKMVAEVLADGYQLTIQKKRR